MIYEISKHDLGFLGYIQYKKVFHYIWEIR